MPIPDWWREVSPYLDEALEMSDTQRALWLTSLGVHDPRLPGRVEALVEAHRRLEREHFLEETPGRLLNWSTFEGRRVGAYRVVSHLGDGGMGSVWLAERTDGELTQKVAVKVVGGVWHRPGWRERFLRERQLLATLNHQSIVRPLDAGRTEDGLLYLVMEYVEGQ